MGYIGETNIFIKCEKKKNFVKISVLKYLLIQYNDHIKASCLISETAYFLYIMHNIFLTPYKWVFTLYARRGFLKRGHHIWRVFYIKT